MVDGIKPAQASERLAVFQSRFDGLFRAVFKNSASYWLANEKRDFENW